MLQKRGKHFKIRNSIIFYGYNWRLWDREFNDRV